ncbi:MAG: hypothetical protein PVS2B3_03240 [Steroidobacteraceae bacterium]
MKTQNFSTSFTVSQTPQEAFDAITNVRGWWSGEFEGTADKAGDEFTYRYEDLHYSRQKVTELVPGKRVVWRVLDSNLSFTRSKGEWTGTQITFDIAPRGDKTEVRFTHVGLVPDCECYGACSGAWSSIITKRLRNLIASGTGQTDQKL